MRWGGWRGTGRVCRRWGSPSHGAGPGQPLLMGDELQLEQGERSQWAAAAPRAPLPSPPTRLRLGPGLFLSPRLSWHGGERLVLFSGFLE